jgi:hypothetical protein
MYCTHHFVALFSLGWSLEWEWEWKWSDFSSTHPKTLYGSTVLEASHWIQNESINNSCNCNVHMLKYCTYLQCIVNCLYIKYDLQLWQIPMRRRNPLFRNFRIFRKPNLTLLWGNSSYWKYSPAFYLFAALGFGIRHIGIGSIRNVRSPVWFKFKLI